MTDRITDIEQIREQVRTRRAEEEARRAAAQATETDPEALPSEFACRCLAANELGDGIGYQEVNRGQVLYQAAAAEWLAWAGHHWKIDTTGRASNLVEQVVRRVYGPELDRVRSAIRAAEDSGEAVPSYLLARRKQLVARIKRLRSVGGVRSTLEFARSGGEAPLVIEGPEVDAQPHLLACPNGVVDLRTGEGRDGRPEDYLLRATPTPWEGLSAPCPLWEDTMLKIFVGDTDMVDFMQRLLGHALWGAVVENKFPNFIGDGGNGKSTISEAIGRILGELSGTLPPEMLLDQHRVRNSAAPSSDLMRLRGLRVAWLSESSENARFAGERVKQLSGGDSICGRNPHDKFMSQFTPSHTLFFSSNHKPAAPAGDYAFWRRVILVQFPARFVKEPAASHEFPKDKHLGEKLKAEDSGILAWLVRGCLAWQQRGLDPPAAVLAATDEYRSDEDHVGLFLESRCEIGPDFEVPAAELYDAFVEFWHAEQGKNEPSQKRFGTWMVRRFERSKRSPKIYYGVRIS